ncbi:MAG: VWA domain-containing protein [Spirochaetaceae bacterium]|jgi:Ca-activated chloride channel family protein|nr:VWA domain-containing protein [Spirochaetaceae bacterium]
MNIWFEHPVFAVLGALGVLLILIIAPYYKSARSAYVPLGPPGGVAFKPSLQITVLIKTAQAFELAGAFLLGIACAGPFFITTETVWLNRGADILFVLDISPSMAALDMENRSRFTLARNLVRDFAVNRPSDAIGLIGVGNDAALLLPPTVDHQALFSRLDALNLGELGDGTALGMGLAIAGLHIGNSSAPRKAVVLITDGENNAGAIHPETAAAVLPKLGVSLWVIGVGSGGEVHIDYLDPVAKVHRVGIFDSRFDPESLKAIARKGEGYYIPAPSVDAFAHAFARIDKSEMTISRSGVVSRTQAFHAPFIAAAAGLLLLARFIRRCLLGSFF